MLTEGLKLPRKVAAEMIGTFALVYAGCGAIVVNAADGAITHVGVSVVFGLVVAVMIYAVGHISGAHFNPAVTLAFAVGKRFPWREVPAYVVGQCAAAILAAGCISVTFGSAASLGATAASIAMGPAFLTEVIITAMLMFVITSVATDARAEGQMAGLAIGATVMLAALFAGPVTGASMNPARSLGPALVSGELSGLWLYVVAPCVGAVLGALGYHAVRCSDDPAGQAEGCC